jgi:hypothetical protein
VITEVLSLMQRAAAIKEFTGIVERSISQYVKAGVPLSPSQVRYQEGVSLFVRTSAEPPERPHPGA